ncbi:hypothetical protein AWW66_10215 [Micromonospora rosaria]|uniref:Uncharacterized protein n=1 Tax=Micromonospora rosaria TaxID=47874 RepID=A0A136PUD8_9ACTN|nr:hypothetical protein AWW66_10215 [Micromonospora rosaria]
MGRWKWFQRQEEPVDQVGPATRYPLRDGQPRGRLVVRAVHPVVPRSRTRPGTDATDGTNDER